MLHGKIFIATCLATNVARQVARRISRVTPQFCNLQWQQNVSLRFARKVEISLTFCKFARQVAACDMSIATCNAILWKLGNQSLSFCRKRFQAGVRDVNNFQRERCKLRKNIGNVWHPFCNLQCFLVVIVARKISSCNMAFIYSAIIYAVRIGFNEQTNGLHMRYNFWYISLPYSAKQQREFAKIKFYGVCGHTAVNF